jgi:hypothetical protein
MIHFYLIKTGAHIKQEPPPSPSSSTSSLISLDSSLPSSPESQVCSKGIELINPLQIKTIIIIITYIIGAK